MYCIEFCHLFSSIQLSPDNDWKEVPFNFVFSLYLQKVPITQLRDALIFKKQDYVMYLFVAKLC